MKRILFCLIMVMAAVSDAMQAAVYQDVATVHAVPTGDNFNNKYEKDHWDAVNAVKELMLADVKAKDNADADVTLDTYYDDVNDKLQDKVAQDKSEYEYAGWEERVYKLYFTLYGDNGIKAKKTDGQIDAVLAAYKTAKQEGNTELLNGTTADEVFGNATNAAAVLALWNDMKAYLEETSEGADPIGAKGIWEVYKTKYPTITDAIADIDKAKALLKQTEDNLNLVKDKFDAAVATEGDHVNTVVFDKTINLEKLKEYTSMIASNVKTYDELYALYQDVYDGLTDTYLDKNAVASALETVTGDEDRYGDPRGRHLFTARLHSFYENTFADELTGTPVGFYTEDINMPAIKALIDTYSPHNLSLLTSYDPTAYTEAKSRLEKLGLFDLTDVTLNDGLIRKTVLEAERNKTAFDGLINIKGKLGTRVEEILNLLKNNYEKTEEGDKLIQLIKGTYKPMPVQYAGQIDDVYKAGTAVADGPDGLIIYEDDGETVKHKPIYMILDEALDAVNSLYVDFDTNGYFAAIEAENNQTFANEIGASYDAALDRYNQMVADMKDFKAPKDPTLLEAYNAAFKAANDEIFDVPYDLKDLKAEADTHKEEANDLGKHYNATADKDLIVAQQTSTLILMLTGIIDRAVSLGISRAALL